MHFIYKKEVDLSSDLMQGDILEKNQEIKETLKHYFPYYIANKNNTHFVVLTQSCDLVRRSGGQPQTKYINLGVIRPFSSYLEKVIQLSAEKSFSLQIPVCTKRTRNSLTSSLQRLLNNNEPEYFFLPAEPSLKFPEDSCVLLKLSIAIKVEHYEKCLNARILQLDDPFQHKLGWLVGQMYSRVGTRDWEIRSMNEVIKQYLDISALWIEDKVKKDLLSKIEEWKNTNPGLPLDDEILSQLIKKIPNRKSKVIERIRVVIKEDNVINHLIREGHVTNDQIDKIIKSVESDLLFTEHLN